MRNAAENPLDFDYCYSIVECYCLHRLALADWLSVQNVLKIKGVMILLVRMKVNTNVEHYLKHVELFQQQDYCLIGHR